MDSPCKSPYHPDESAANVHGIQHQDDGFTVSQVANVDHQQLFSRSYMTALNGKAGPSRDDGTAPGAHKAALSEVPRQLIFI